MTISWRTFRVPLGSTMRVNGRMGRITLFDEEHQTNHMKPNGSHFVGSTEKSRSENYGIVPYHIWYYMVFAHAMWND
eukprot:scaffold41945_cov199-Amphora_coffeaeformis.AAC.1